jgi:lipoprotein-anchoring transpeptidase ErfK/SrfK
MRQDFLTDMNRRRFGQLMLAAAAGLAVWPAASSAQTLAVDPLRDYVPDAEDQPRLLRRVSGLSTRQWQNYFDNLSQDAILVNVNDRVLHYWGADGFYRMYPTSVPLTEEMTRRGRTSVTLKRPDPEWRATEAMLRRNPQLPTYVGPGPDNPLGVRALNLGWPAYRIHGTNDIRKIGRQSSNGCIGLFNEHIIEVYDRAQVGTPVLLI